MFGVVDVLFFPKTTPTVISCNTLKFQLWDQRCTCSTFVAGCNVGSCSNANIVLTMIKPSSASEDGVLFILCKSLMRSFIMSVKKEGLITDPCQIYSVAAGCLRMLLMPTLIFTKSMIHFCLSDCGLEIEGRLIVELVICVYLLNFDKWRVSNSRLILLNQQNTIDSCKDK